MDPRHKQGNSTNLLRLDREETKLWRLALLLIALLGIGFAAAAWDNISAISSQYRIVPIAMAVIAIGVAYYSGRKRNQIATLRAGLQKEEAVKAPEKAEEDIEHLVDIIRRSQRGFRELVDSFDDVVLAVSMDGTIQASNRTFADILGLSFTNFVYKPIVDFVEYPTITEVQRILPRLLDRQQWSGVLEVRFRHEHSTRHFDCAVRTIRKDGEVTGVSVWGREITQQREREARFTELFETLHEGVYFSTPEGRLLDANNALVQMLGFENKAQLLATRITDLYVDPAERERGLAEVNQRATIQDREIRLRRRDNTEIICLDSSRAIYDNEGRVVRYQGTLEDITSRRRTETQLSEQQQFNRRLIECFPDAILVVDKDLRYTFVSSRMHEILGWDPDEIIGKTVASTNELSEPARLYRDVLAGVEDVGHIEFAAEHRDGTWRTLRATASPLVGANNEVVGAVASVRDVTSSKQLEQQLVQAERLAAMGQMIDGFAHELNNPLTAIMGAIDLIDAEENGTMEKHRRLLKEQSRRAVEIVQNLLFFSRPPARGNSRLNLNDLIQRTLLLHQYSLRMSGISVDFLPEPSLPMFEGDANQLMQVFLNLLINAEQAIRSVRERGTIRVRLSRTENKLRISFQDDGPGIPQGKLRNVFDPFYSTKRPGGGTGMGLSVALGIVRNHGGDIDFQSAPNTGAVFTVSLPLKSSIVPEPPMASEAAASTSVN